MSGGDENYCSASFSKFKKRAFQVKEVAKQMDTSASGAEMRKVLGPWDLTVMGVGAIIGSGVFVLTGVAARKHAGPAVSISYLISSLAAMMSALCYAEFAAEMPVAGGAYNYIVVTFGEFPAWLCAWNLVLEYTLSSAAIARGFTSYTAAIFGLSMDDGTVFRFDISEVVSVDWPALLIVLSLCLLLAKGTKDSSITNHIITGINLFVIGLIIIVGFIHVDPDNYQPFAPNGINGIFMGASQVFFSFIGFDTLATVAEEVRNPNYDLPFGIITSLAICGVLYVLMCFVITGMRPYQEIDIDAPFPQAFHDLGVEWVRSIVAIGAVTGIVTSLLVSLMGQSRIYMILGREALLPQGIAKINSKTGTPINATILSAVLGGSLAFLIDIELLAELVSAGTLSVFYLVCLAVLYRRYSIPIKDIPEGTFQYGILVRMVLLTINSIVFAVTFVFEAPFWVSLLFFLSWAAITASFYWLPVQYEPSKFNIPFKPITPSLGVFATLHLICSLRRKAYFFFAPWLVGVLLGYLFYGVHGAEAKEQLEIELMQENDRTHMMENGNEKKEVEMSSRIRKGSSKGALLEPGLPSSTSMEDVHKSQNGSL